ncbi:hypothetical protein Y35_GM000064 [Pseudomonas phage YS35]|nr:hypothetical protein QE343_gp064 [Pseudomonas phage YS35]ATI16037.1 hypothetical protein Y35_GM000064 [Pseudomonas phage YS35]
MPIWIPFVIMLVVLVGFGVVAGVLYAIGSRSKVKYSFKNNLRKK